MKNFVVTFITKKETDTHVSGYSKSISVEAKNKKEARSAAILYYNDGNMSDSFPELNKSEYTIFIELV